MLYGLTNISNLKKVTKSQENIVLGYEASTTALSVEYLTEKKNG